MWVLPVPLWAERDDVLASFNPFAARQFQHLHLVQGRDRPEVEAVPLPGSVCLHTREGAFDGLEFGGLDPVARQGIAQQ